MITLTAHLRADGRPRREGVRAFLASPEIALPERTPDDAPAARPCTANAY